MLEIYVQELDTGEIFQFPMVPDRIQVETATRFISYDIMNIGEHKVPNGEDPNEISWSGILPGEGRKNAPYVQAWQSPADIQVRWSVWRNKGKKLQLTIPGTTVNQAVYLESYRCEYTGGAGDTEYQITFCAAREVIVETESDAANQDGSGAGVTTTAPATQPQQAKTYTVKSGDSLWKIAQATLGSGSRWREIYELNQGTIGSNPNLIYPGQVYNLPA